MERGRKDRDKSKKQKLWPFASEESSELNTHSLPTSSNFDGGNNFTQFHNSGKSSGNDQWSYGKRRGSHVDPYDPKRRREEWERPEAITGDQNRSGKQYPLANCKSYLSHSYNQSKENTQSSDYSNESYKSTQYNLGKHKASPECKVEPMEVDYSELESLIGFPSSHKVSDGQGRANVFHSTESFY